MAAPQSQSVTPRLQPQRSFRLVLFVLAVLLFLGSTLVAYLQSPRPNPFQPVSFLSLDWWRYPIERNAFKRLPVITSDLNAVFALPGTDKVWAVGDGGMIVYSDNGGKTWTQQNIVATGGQTSEKREGGYVEGGFGGSQEPKQEPPPPEPAKGARLDVPNLIPHAYAAEKENPSQQALQYQEPPTPQHQEPAKNIEQPQQSPVQQGQPEPSKQPPAANSPTPNKPATPEPVSPKSRPETANLNSIHFINEQEGWVVGDGGTILHTADGGTTWTPQTSGTTDGLSSVHLTPDGRQGWTVGGNGTILHTTDGGATWMPQTSGTTASLLSVHFTSDGRQGWTVGNGRTNLHTTDGGSTWTPQISSTSVGLALASVYFTPDGRQGWTVGGNGTILHTTDGGAAWMPQTSGTTASLLSVHFTSDGRQGWVVGGGTIFLTTHSNISTGSSITTLEVVGGGTILHTTDGGTTWTPQSSGTTASLESAHFTSDGRQGWIVGDGGTLLHTADGGQTWRSPVAAPLRRPAPWYYLVGWLLPLALLFVASQQRQDDRRMEEESVADRLVSDRPLEAGDPDPLGFSAIAQGLSRFLRNEKTQPPLTIAITGEWGTGKSSLMNLLKADLERYGFRPVWFNAWYHQQEDQLLAALLENVRAQGVPPWWHPASWGFRVRLLWARGWRHWGLFLVLLAISTSSFGYFIAHPQTIGEALQQVRQWLDALITSGNGSPSPAGTDSKSLFTLFGSVLTFLFALKKGLTAFGVDPAVLLASASDSARVRDLGAQASFRHKFAEQFRDVTRALHPRTMLILIDDLDRCRPEKVLEVLEAINFLVASGECYVVMGMALERVERCVGLGFKDVAEELMDMNESDQVAASVSEEGKKKRAAFARQYLEKLINIEVPVPTPTSGQTTQLVTAETPFSRTANAWTWPLTTTTTRLSRYVPWLLLLFILTGSFWLGVRFDMSPEEPPPPPVSKPGGPISPTAGEGIKDPPPPINPPTAGIVRPSGKGEFIPGQSSRPATWPVITPLILMLVVVAWIAWKKQEEVVVKDSPEFVEALKIWLPVITAKQNTPRSVKRFLNRVHYLAMLQRPQGETIKSTTSLFSRIFQTNGAPQTNGTIAQDKVNIPESVLVALSALHHSYALQIQQGNGFLPGVNTIIKEEQTWRRGKTDRDIRPVQQASEEH